MRIYGSIQTSFWENSEIQSLPDQAKVLAIYLLTGPHSNMLGCLRLPDGYISEDLKWEIEISQNSFKKLSEIDFLTRDIGSSWVVIHHFLKWNPVQNPRQGIGIQKLFDAVPTQSCVLKPLITGLLTHGKYLDKGFIDRLYKLQKESETVSENCLADKEQNKDQDQNKKIYIAEDIEISDQTNYSHLIERIKTKNRQHALRSQAIEVLEFLNEKTGKRFRHVDTNLNMIIARLKTGATVIDCRQIIAMKYREWKKNPEMLKYVRPETLFATKKFESYIGELVLPKDEGDKNEQK